MMNRGILFAAALFMAAASGAPAFAQVTCNQIGNQVFCSDGTTYNQIGNTVYGSDGSTYNQIGNQTFSNDGTTYNRIGNQ